MRSAPNTPAPPERLTRPGTRGNAMPARRPSAMEMCRIPSCELASSRRHYRTHTQAWKAEGGKL